MCAWGDQVARKTTSGRKAVSDRRKKMPMYYYDLLGKRKQIHLITTDALHEGLQGSAASGLNHQDQVDEAIRWFLRAYQKKPETSFVAATRKDYGCADRTYWIDKELYASLLSIANQTRVSMARVFHTAVTRFVEANR